MSVQTPRQDETYKKCIGETLGVKGEQNCVGLTLVEGEREGRFGEGRLPPGLQKISARLMRWPQAAEVV